MSLDSMGPAGGLAGGRMTHSLSTPSGVDGTPSTQHHRGGKKLTVRVQMLDDSITMFQVQVSRFIYYFTPTTNMCSPALSNQKTKNLFL